DSPEVHRLAARAARQSGDLEAAGRHLYECQRREDPPADDTLFEWALLRIETGTAGAVEEGMAAKARAGHPQARLIYEALARAYLRRLRLTECVALLDAWQKLDPDSPVLHSLRGQVWNQVRVFGRAADEFEETVRLDPDRSADRLRLALALLEVGRAGDALPHLRRVRAERPDDPEVAVYLAFALGKERWDDEARGLLDGVLAADPDHVPALVGRARLDLEADRPAEAERYARRVLELSPKNRQAVLLLHQALVTQGRDAEAAEAKARMLELDDLLQRYYDLANRHIPARPNDPELQYQLGQLLVEMGHPAEAAGWWRKVVEANPTHAAAHRALADYLQSVGRPDEAAEHRRLAGL
ncbi:MAG: tetratricopeptide repeat protein, partial [Gemmataceae bacterium]|nr:tetratricopeptide repeat protein [Gemmataceae bacterium]